MNKMNLTVSKLVVATALASAFRVHAGDLNPPPGPIAATHRTPINASTTPGDSDSQYRIVSPGSYSLTGNITGVGNKSGIEPAPATPPPDTLADPSGLSKTRFISFSIPAQNIAAAEETALRIKLVSLHQVIPPYSGGPSVPFTSFEGQVRWVGPPTQYVESSSNATAFYAASLQCTPYYQDWSTVGLLHVTGSAIVPSSVYEVENVAASCAGIEASCTAVSAPLCVGTTRWGDVAEAYNPPATTAQPDFSDIQSMVAKFRSAPGAPIKARVLIAGNDANGNINAATISTDFNFSHIAACVDAFRGKPYPYTIAACP